MEMSKEEARKILLDFGMSTLRTQILTIPAWIVHWARREYTRIQNVLVAEEIMAMIVKKARSFSSWVLDPPILASAA